MLKAAAFIHRSVSGYIPFGGRFFYKFKIKTVIFSFYYMYILKERLRSSLRKLYGRYGDLIKQYEVHSSECYTTFLTMTI